MKPLTGIPDYYDHAATRLTGRPTWPDGRPVPWMTYPAISFLEQIDLSGKHVFEYGAGSSTEYWSARGADVLSVENNFEWFEKVSSLKLPNTRISLASGTQYVDAISQRAKHDIIVIDGRWRYDCGLVAFPRLAENGMIILDNSERYPKITAHLRDCGLIQVDMIGYGPINCYIWATSFFLHRKFSFRPAGNLQPRNAPGLIDSAEAEPKWFEQNKPGAIG